MPHSQVRCASGIRDLFWLTRFAAIRIRVFRIPWSDCKDLVKSRSFPATAARYFGVVVLPLSALLVTRIAAVKLDFRGTNCQFLRSRVWPKYPTDWEGVTLHFEGLR